MTQQYLQGEVKAREMRSTGNNLFGDGTTAPHQARQIIATDGVLNYGIAFVIGRFGNWIVVLDQSRLRCVLQDGNFVGL